MVLVPLDQKAEPPMHNGKQVVEREVLRLESSFPPLFSRTERSSPRFRRFPTNNGPDIALIRHQGGRGGGWICIVAVVVDRLSPQWVICRSDERRNQRDSGMETLVSTSFQRLIRKGIDWRYLFRVYIRVYFNFFQSWTRFY